MKQNEMKRNGKLFLDNVTINGIIFKLRDIESDGN